MTVTRATASRTAKVETPPARPSNSVELSRAANSDKTLKMTTTADTITLAGTAFGSYAVNPYDRDSTTASDFERIQEIGSNVSVEFDKDKMPKFDTTHGFTEKNKWYFAHVAEVAPKKGQTAKEVLQALAAKINSNTDYKALVKGNADGSATLKVVRN